MGTPLDLNSFLSNFTQQKDNIQDLINKLTTNLSNNMNSITTQPQVPAYTPPPAQPAPNYAYFLNPPIANPIQSQLTSTLQLLENSLQQQRVVPPPNPYNGYTIPQDPLQSLLSNPAFQQPQPSIGTIQNALNEQIEALKTSIASKAQHLLAQQQPAPSTR